MFFHTLSFHTALKARNLICIVVLLASECWSVLLFLRLFLGAATYVHIHTAGKITDIPISATSILLHFSVM